MDDEIRAARRQKPPVGDQAMIGFRIGAGVRHTLTGCLGRVLPGRPCRGIVTVLFDGDAAAQTVPARSLRLVADRYSAAKAWQAFVSTPR